MEFCMNIHIFEMPLDFGASRRGADMGPSAIRLAGIKERLETLGHSTKRYFSPMQIAPQEYTEIGNPKAKYLTPIVTANTQLAREVETALNLGDFPLILGGDHSIALGSLAGFSAACKKTPPPPQNFFKGPKKNFSPPPPNFKNKF